MRRLVLGGCSHLGFLALITAALLKCFFLSHSSSYSQVLFLRGLSLSLGVSYVIQWEEVEEDLQRLDCYPQENADEAKCKARGCTWSVRSGSGGWSSHAQYLYTIFLDFWKCISFCSKKQPSSQENVPWCFYPKDYGYFITSSRETDSGITVDITRNTKYSGSPYSGSPDINSLRVEIRYHTGDMLQFKVCVCLVFFAARGAFIYSCLFSVGVIPCVPPLAIFPKHMSCMAAPCKVAHSLTMPSCSDLGPGHTSLRGTSASVSSWCSRDWWEQETLQGHCFQKPIRHPGRKEEHRNQDVSICHGCSMGLYCCIVSDTA